MSAEHPDKKTQQPATTPEPEAGSTAQEPAARDQDAASSPPWWSRPGFAGWMAIAGAILAILPTFLPLFTLYYEEDLSAMLEGKHGWHFWVTNGRLIWRWIGEPLYGPLTYPFAHYVFQLIYTALNTALLLLIAQLFRMVTGSWKASLFAAAAIFCHFYFAEFRFFNGNFSNTAMVLQAAGFVGALIVAQRPQRYLQALAFFAAVAGCVLAFNAHQAGAMLIAPLTCMAFSKLLIGGFRPQPDFHRAFWIAALGAVAGGLLYGLELRWIANTYGLIRTDADNRGELLLRMRDLILASAYTPHLPWYSFYPGIMRWVFWLVLAGALVMGNRIAWWRRLLLVPCVVVAGYVGGLSPALANGFVSSRMMLPVIVMSYGFVLLMLVHSSWLRKVPRAALLGIFGFVFLLNFAAHARLVAYGVWLRLEDRETLQVIEQRLLALGVKEGDQVDFFANWYRSPYFHFGDYGRPPLVTSWGQAAMLRQDCFAERVLPPGIVNKPHQYQNAPPVPPVDGFVRRIGEGKFLIDGNYITVNQLRVEQRLLSPFAKFPTLPLASLLARATALPPKEQFATHWPDSVAEKQLVLRTVPGDQGTVLLMPQIVARELQNWRVEVQSPIPQQAAEVGVGYLSSATGIVPLKGLPLSPQQTRGVIELKSVELPEGAILFVLLRAQRPDTEGKTPSVLIRGSITPMEAFSGAPVRRRDLAGE